MNALCWVTMFYWQTNYFNNIFSSKKAKNQNDSEKFSV